MTEQLQTIIFIFRHGQTDLPYSADPTIDNQRKLSATGQHQMKRVGEYLKSFAPTAIYASPRARTIECARIIQEQAEIPGEIIEKNELYEIYSDADFKALKTILPNFLAGLVASHRGDQIVCVTHMDVIQGGFVGYDLTETETNFPCLQGEGYRLVFAGNALVECQKLQPARG